MSLASPYVLSARLHGHASDVRAIASHVLPDGTQLILSGSRDQSARLWVRCSDGSYEMHVLDSSSGFVNAVAFFCTDAGVYALTAGQDTLVHAFLLEHTGGKVSVSTTPQFSLLGHAANVCSLRTYKSEYIVSGSWDSTVKVWKRWECVATLTGHAHSVWSVLPIDEDRILSASADKTVCLWSLSSPKEPIYTFEGATQAVRDLACVSDALFASAGNDGQLRVYPIQGGAAHKTIAALPAFVYSLSSLPGYAGLVSSGEDRCFRVWTNNALAQLVPLPALSVWCVTAMPNGDIACGASDGTVSIFTHDASRSASAQDAQQFATDVATQALNTTEVQGVPVFEDAAKGLQSNGSFEGEARIIREGSKSTRFTWSIAFQRWVPTGVVTEGASSSQKTMYQGKEYDYVFDVDIADGAPPLKLPYNVTENTYVAASRFLEQNNLPASFLDQVVRFLEKNTQGVSMSNDASAAAVDPYTGASRYVPAESSNPASSAPPPPSSLKTLPQTQFQVFAQIQLDAAQAKIQAFSSEVQGATLTEDDHAALSALVAALSKGSGTMPVDILSKLLHAWPISVRFPLLDLLRAAALHPCTQPFTSIVSDALIGANWDGLDAPGIEPKSASANAMLALRTLANGFAAPGGAATMGALALEALATLRQPPWHVLNRAGHTALATVLLNYSILAVTQPKFEHGSLLLEMLNDILAQPTESECVYRSLVALGNLVRIYTTDLKLCAPCSSSLSASHRSSSVQLALTWRDKLSEPRIQNVCADLSAFL